MAKIVLFTVLVCVSSARTRTVINADDSFSNQSVVPRDLDPDTGLNIVRFLKKYGYPLESHNVTTEDDYILTLHRIPYGRYEDDAGNTPRPPVLLMHGLLSSSIDWVVLGPGKSLGLVLADLGYDVWLGNSRGNTWSRHHKTLDPDNNDTYWDFSFHEMGVYDLPAVIDYILEISERNAISYVGHSAGTTQFFVMASTRPDYNRKVNVIAALSPITYLSNTSSPLIRLLSDHQTVFDLATTLLNVHEFMPYTWWSSLVIDFFCNDKSPVVDICADFMFLLAGFDTKEMNKTLITVLNSNTPAGTSVKEIDHFLQEINSGYFRQYDYGIGNIAKYGRLSPPEYNVSKITTYTALYYAQNDLLNAVSNVEKFASKLNNVEKNLIDLVNFNHFDFIFAEDVDTLVNYNVINLLNRFNDWNANATTQQSTDSTVSPSPNVTPKPGSGPVHTLSHIVVSFCLTLLCFF